MMPWEGERRGHARVPLEWPALARRRGERSWVPVRTVNLSCGGVYCLASEPYEAGEELELVLPLPEQVRAGVKLECRVSVVRAEPAGSAWGLACRFEDYRVVIAASDRSAEELSRQAPALALSAGAAPAWRPAGREAS